LHVEEHEIRLQALNRLEPFDAVARLSDDLDAARLAEQIRQLVSRQLLIVDENGT
jgi:hypothetical protein